MIRKPNNWENVKEFTDRPKLPLGAYVCKIKQASVTDSGFGDQLCILFDIAEGDYNGYFTRDYAENTNANKKWRGVLRIWLPKDDGSDKDELTKRTLKGAITAIEKSNPGYLWNWDETSLVGKQIGVVFRNEEWAYEGKTGWAVRPFRAISIDNVRYGEFTLPKDKPLKNKSTSYYTDTTIGSYAPAASDFSTLDDDDSDLPF